MSRFSLLIFLGTYILFSLEKNIRFHSLKLNEAMEKEQKKAQALELEAEKKMKGLSLKDKDITAAFDANGDEDVVF
jgi:hypothetical protein